MAKLTQRARLLAGLNALGATWIKDHVSSRYTVFAHPTMPGRFYYLGHAAGLRAGKTIASSVSINDTGKAIIMAAGDKALAELSPADFA